MKILKVNIPGNSLLGEGLSGIKMDRLGQLVLLAGRNGSGKTRLLNMLRETISGHPKLAQVESAKKGLIDWRNKLASIDQSLSQMIEIGNADKQKLKHEASLEGEKSDVLQQIQRLELILDKNSFLTIENDSENRSVVHFIPKKLDLRDPKSMNPHDLETRSKRAYSLGMDNLHEDALAKIQDLHTQFWNATHQDSQLDATEKELILSEYRRLEKTINFLLGAPLKNDSRGTATLFGFPIGQAKLSDGQKVLLQLAVAIHCQGTNLSETILILDEPENHLHPSSIIEVLETLLANIPNGQIWVATHNVSVLAHFHDEGSLWYMDQGEVSYAGKTQEKVLESLLGAATRIARQREFLETPEAVALLKYAHQCLCPPTAVMTGPGDPQVTQIRNVIDTLYARRGQLRIVDYGAGQGRLIASLIENSGSADEISSKLDYVAYDVSQEFREECESHINKIYGEGNRRWFGSYNELLETNNKKSFHLVIMCNVLHEISPVDWKDLFGPTGTLTELLTDDGQFLIVEDHRLPVGENAHEYGFIVMDTAALKDIFAVRGADSPILTDTQREGRLHQGPELAHRSHGQAVDVEEIFRRRRQRHGNAAQRIFDEIDDGKIFRATHQGNQFFQGEAAARSVFRFFLIRKGAPGEIGCQ